MEEDKKTFLTPSYQRKAYKAYYDRKKTDPEFMARMKESSRNYYQKNREKILAKRRARCELKKKREEWMNNLLIDKEIITEDIVMDAYSDVGDFLENWIVDNLIAMDKYDYEDEKRQRIICYLTDMIDPEFLERCCDEFAKQKGYSFDIYVDC